jgi:hypothetical protein
MLSNVSANIFTLKMAIAMFAETLDNFQHSTRLIPESRTPATKNEDKIHNSSIATRIEPSRPVPRLKDDLTISALVFLRLSFP